MTFSSRALLFGGIAAAAVLAVAGGFLFFSNVPTPGAAREQIVAEVPRMQQADIDRIIAERKARIPRPSAVASVSERIGANTLRREGQFAHLFAGAVPTVLQNRNRGDELYAEGRYAEAIEFWTTEAEAGDRWSAFRLGSEYLRGDPSVVARDVKAGARWIRLAAIKNEPNAQFTLAHLHDVGEGVTADPVQAAAWYLKSAQRGHAEAQFAIAGRFQEGRGIARDRVEALKYYILADRHRPKAKQAATEETEAEAARDVVASEPVPAAAAPAKPEVTRAPSPAAPAPAEGLRADMSAEEVAEAERRAAAFAPIQD